MININIHLNLIRQIYELLGAPFSAEPPASDANLKRVYDELGSDKDEINFTLLEILSHKDLSLTLRSFASMLTANTIEVSEKAKNRYITKARQLLKNEKIPAIKADLALSLARAGNPTLALEYLDKQSKQKGLHNETRALLEMYKRRINSPHKQRD